MFKQFLRSVDKKPSALDSKCRASLDGIKEELVDIKNSIRTIEKDVDSKNNINRKFVLTTTPLYFSLLLFFAILIGSFKSRFYLDNIGYSSIFSEIIGNPSALIGIMVAYAILVVALLFYFAMPFLLFLFIHYNKEAFKNLEKERWCIIRLYYMSYIAISVAIIFWGISVYYKCDFDGYVLLLGLLSCFILPFFIFLSFKKSTEFSFFCITIAFLFFYSYIYPMLYANIIPSFEYRSNWQWAVFFGFPATNIVINFFALWVFRSQQKEGECLRNNDNMFMGAICAFCLILYAGFLSLFTRFTDLSLYIPRFIERPTNSSWYIIHNGNTTSDKINGLSKTDIQNLKLEFKPQNKDVKNIENPNTLYSYMAWNLGNTKVFCPQSVDFFDNESNNKENSKKCLAIDGKYLQLVSEHYLAK